jgi:bifunctional non-homologous end joining protein LigD
MAAFNPISGKLSVAEAFLRLRPMLANVGQMPAQPRQYAFELDWGGASTLCYHDGEQILFCGSNGAHPANRFPELTDLGRFLAKRRAVFDGQLVVLDRSGIPDAAALRKRLRGNSPAFSAVEETPVRFMISDLLFDRGRWILNAPLEERLRRLGGLNLDGLFWRENERQIGQAQTILSSAREKGLTRILAKRLTSPYEPRRKSPDWLLINARS